jgi:branched-chain amino acid transport system ATP-binding protein
VHAAAGGPPILSASDVRVAFGGLVAVDGVSVDVWPGELVGLVGPNGAGKTTYLNAVSGLVPMQGRVVIGGRDVTHLPLHRRASAGIGRTFQNVELLASLSVIDNILLGTHHRTRYSLAAACAFLRRARREELRRRDEVEEIIEFFELERWRNREVSSLSYGRQKLIGLARAVVSTPSVLLLDEVGSGLNREEREDLARYILRLRASGNIGIVWIEHDVRMVLDLADRVVVLDHGKHLATGLPEEVFRGEEVKRAFAGVGAPQ